MQDKRALSEKQAAEYIGMSTMFLRKDRMDGPRENHATGPVYVKKGRRVLYLIDDLDKWLEANRVERGKASG